MSIRKPDFAGSWYPADQAECEREIQHFLEDTSMQQTSKTDPVGGIVPHAGWYFSGSVACNVINRLSRGDTPDVVFVFGMHLHENSGNYIMKEGAWDTPFGSLEIHEELAERLDDRFSFQVETPGRHAKDNTIELQLPFVKYFFTDARIVPMGVPPNKESLEIGEAAAELANDMGLKSRVIGSTDLTHYGANYGFVSQGQGKEAIDWARDVNDKQVIDAMLAMDPVKVLAEARANQSACCAGAAATAISFAKKQGAQNPETVAYSNSYDKSPGDSFVGYVGIIF